MEQKERKIPQHVAIILDGNGRWAKKRMLPRTAGHVQGSKNVEVICEAAHNLGVKYLTVYAFSTENWNRPKQEVDTLMHLIGWAIERETPDLIKNNVHLNLIGDIERMPAEAYDRLHRCELATAHCNGLTMTLALSYSSRWEIINATKKIAADVKNGQLNIDDIDDEVFSKNLTTHDIPDPDLLIRTGGDERISNYLLWQIAYSELYFTNILWPDFGKSEYADAIIDYQSRERRYGKTSEQVQSEKNK